MFRLWYNAPPAKIFMGDTGSLSLGGSLVAVAIIVKHEIVLSIIGGLFVLETVSVIIQVASFKLTGKRIFKWLQYIITLKKRMGRVNYCNSVLDNSYYSSPSWFSNIKTKVTMPLTSKLEELSFLVYGLGKSGLSVIKFFKE